MQVWALSQVSASSAASFSRVTQAAAPQTDISLCTLLMGSQLPLSSQTSICSNICITQTFSCTTCRTSCSLKKIKLKLWISPNWRGGGGGKPHTKPHHNLTTLCPYLTNIQTHSETVHLDSISSISFTLGFVGIFAPCRWKYLSHNSTHLSFSLNISHHPSHLFQPNKPTAHCSFMCHRCD